LDVKFTKEDMFKALRLGHSHGNSYGSLFNPRTVKKLPKVQAWLNNPMGKAGERFHNMTISEFWRYQEEHLRHGRAKDVRGEGKKWMSVEDSDEDTFGGPSCNVKRGKGHCVVLDSSDLEMSA
jgi:hypothetical protein